MTPTTLPLPDLEPAPPADPASLDALRQAYTGAGLYRLGISFERALATPCIRTCLANTAHARHQALHRRTRP
jgi:hypothetical protein